MTGRTLFDKIWDDHRITTLEGGVDLLFVDRHLIHDLVAGPVLDDLERRGLRVAAPELTWAVPDHSIPTVAGPQRSQGSAISAKLLDSMRRQTRKAGIGLFDIGSGRQGIVHVIGPELGLTLPGTILLCGDSHTCTHGGLGALAFGIGQSEVAHVLATQTIRQKRPRRMRITIDGPLAQQVSSKDVILYLIGRHGTASGTGHAVEYAGTTVAAMDIEARLTLCNLSIEMGAKIGMIAPDDQVFDYLAERPHAPRGELFDRAVASWRALCSDEDASFDRELSVVAAEIAPQVTWGTSPQDVLPVSGHVPAPESFTDAAQRRAAASALDYMGLEPGRPIAGTPVDWVFIGSCANSRIEDLRAAAGMIRGRRVSPTVRAWVVPGSEAVKARAEAEGLDRLFSAAGFEWREPGCSLCLAANGEVVAPGQRTISTTNRNFVGRQGPGARTHLASPVTAVASALEGHIADPRKMAGG